MNCRICYGGPEETELGQLISPCKCTGTAKYVHIMCIQHWRKSNAWNERFLKCDICGYKYSLQRVRVASYLLSRTSRVILTLVLLNALAFALGYIAYPILETTLTDEDIELVLKSPNILLRQLGIHTNRRLLRRGGLLEHNLLGTAALGTIGFFKVSFTFFYSSALRRRRNLSLILVLAGLIYSMVELYKLTRRLGSWILVRISSWIVEDVPEDLDKKDQ